MIYKRLGDYIQPVNNRNKGMITDDLRGLSMTKEFRKSTSNIIGTDLTKYKLVNKNQFACDFMSVIRVHKLPVVLHQEEKPVIVSGAYTVFEVIDQNILNPEYLMMWFRRPEFDRYADFRCDSAIRGGFKWDELCDTQLPIPSIEKQQQIVDEYNTVTNRIQLNEKINANLEATAQALYKHWFVDFEFPNQEGKPYKSSGGKMVYNEELGKEIPVGWECFALQDISNVVDSMHKTPKYSNKGYPMVRVTDINPGFLNLSNTLLVDESVFLEFSRNHKSKTGDIVVSRVGATFGEFSYAYTSQKFCLGQNTAVIIPIKIDSTILFTALSNQVVRNQIEQKVVGSAYNTLSLGDIKELKLIFPTEEKSTIQKKAIEKFKVIFKSQGFRYQELESLSKMQSLLLAKMTQVAPKPLAV